MNLRLFFIVLLSFSSPLFSLPSPCIKGMVVKPAHYNEAFEFVVRYQGKEDRCNEEGFYTIPLDVEQNFKGKPLLRSDMPTTTPSLLFSKDQEHSHEHKNTLNHVAHHTKKDYRYFELSPQGFWQEKKIEYHAVPAHCVHILINPALVDRVESWDLKLPETIIAMPKVILKNSSEQTIKEASNHSSNSSLDLAPFFRRVARVNAEHGAKTKIELPYVE